MPTERLSNPIKKPRPKRPKEAVSVSLYGLGFDDAIRATLTTGKPPKANAKKAPKRRRQPKK
jgi:hypothetical protein